MWFLTAGPEFSLGTKGHDQRGDRTITDLRSGTSAADPGSLQSRARSQPSWHNGPTQTLCLPLPAKGAGSPVQQGPHSAPCSLE